MESPRMGASSARSVRLLTAGVLMMISTYGLVSNFQSVALNSVVDSFHLTGGAQGLMSSLINIGAVAAFLSAPVLQGRVKKTSILLLGAGILALSFCLLGTTRALAGLMAASLLIGIGFGWVDSNCNATMVDLHRADSAKYLGFLHGGFGVGALLAPIVIGSLLFVASWHTVSFYMGALIAAAGVLFFLMLKSAKKGVPSAEKNQPITRAAVKEFLFHKRNALMLLATIFYAVSQSGFLVWIVRYMTLQYHAEQLGSAALSLYWVFGTFSRIFAPRLKIRPLMLLLLAVILTFVFQFLGVLSGSAVVMCVMGALIGLVSGHFVPMILSVASTENHGNSSLISSSFLICVFATNSISPVMMGALASWTNLQIMMLAPAIFAVLASAVVMVILRNEKKAQLNPVA